MSNATETRQRDKHGANRQDGTDDEYDPLSATPDETTPIRRHRQIDHGQASRRQRPPRYYHDRPHIHRPGWRGTD